MNFRAEYIPIVSSVEEAGFFVTEMPLDRGGDRIVCAGLRRDEGGYAGNSFWFAERDGDWFLGVWDCMLYRITDSNTASAIATSWLHHNYSTTASDVPEHLKSQFNLVEVDDSEFDPA